MEGKSNQQIFIRQAFYFILSAIPFWLGIYIVIPMLNSWGCSISVTFSIGILLPLLLLLIGAITVGLAESESGGVGLIKRWRLQPLRRSDIGWLLLLFIITVSSYFLLEGTSNWMLATFPKLSPPESFNLLQTEDTFFGMSLKGNWFVLLVHIGIILLNVLGEELWFRGILFPKHEAISRKWGWLIHGLFYHMWHMFYPWNLLRLLPESLAYGWIAQKTKNTWVCIGSHFLFNGLGLIATISGIVQP